MAAEVWGMGQRGHAGWLHDVLGQPITDEPWDELEDQSLWGRVKWFADDPKFGWYQWVQGDGGRVLVPSDEARQGAFRGAVVVFNAGDLVTIGTTRIRVNFDKRQITFSDGKFIGIGSAPELARMDCPTAKLGIFDNHFDGGDAVNTTMDRPADTWRLLDEFAP